MGSKKLKVKQNEKDKKDQVVYASFADRYPVDGGCFSYGTGPVNHERLEKDIDQLNKDLDTLRSFVLPGGSAAAACLHMARTVARRAERLLVQLADTPGEHFNPACLRYMNRLSDFLFVAARHANGGGRDDARYDREHFSYASHRLEGESFVVLQVAIVRERQALQ